MTLHVEIATDPVPVLEHSIDLELVIEERSVFQFTVDDGAGTLELHQGQVVEFYDGDTLVYGGTIDSVKSRAQLPSAQVLHDVIVRDWHEFADKRRVAGVWRDTTVGAVVLDKIAEILTEEGITVTSETVQTGPAVEEVRFGWSRISDALDALAERAGFTWWISADRVLHFVAVTTYAAPFALDWDHVDAAAPDEHTGNAVYRNRQIGRGAHDVTDPQTEVFHGDGENRTWSVQFPIARVPSSITVNGEAKLIRIGDVEETDPDAFYWNVDKVTITQDSAADILQDDDILEIVYEGRVPVLVIATDAGEVERLAELTGIGTGIVEDVVDLPQATTRHQAFEVIGAKLARYARESKTLTYVTRTPGLFPGQMQQVNLPELGFVDQPFLISSVNITDDPLLRYEVTATNGPPPATAARLFTFLANQAEALVIHENVSEYDSILTFEEIPEAWEWAEDLNVAVNYCPFPSETTYPAEDLYPC